MANNYAPYQDFSVASFRESLSAFDTECLVHHRLAEEFEWRSEWFKCSVAEAVKAIKSAQRITKRMMHDRRWMNRRCTRKQCRVHNSLGAA